MNRIKKENILLLVALMFYVQASAQNKNDTVETILSLEEVVVEGNGRRTVLMKSPHNVVRVERSFLRHNFAGSLMQSLERLPGVQAMSIGSGQSKPAIRGLGFNRMLVAENGVKHEGQQWGDDHGLEIDQFALDNVEIVKGAGALLYGSDAISGVLDLKSSYIPSENFEGEVNLFGRSNNESAGVSARAGGRRNGFLYKAHFTLIDYADYKIPADSIQYYSYYIKLKNRRLRNTAGKERNGGLHLGYLSGGFLTMFRLSDVYAKSGFFADAHGLEVRLSEIDYDRSRRDIDLPRHTVNHFKATNHTSCKFDNLTLEADFAFQNNFRQEFSEPVSHGYMPVPPDSLERQYDKNTLTANLRAKFALAGRHSIHAGFGGEHQNNRRKGWGFIIPDFRMSALGAFVFDRWKLSDNLIVSGGIRLDYILAEIDEYRDWYETPVENAEREFRSENGKTEHKLRSEKLRRGFHSTTWSLGANYDLNSWNFKANVGKSFRAPVPKELGSDGVNYHIFRYEKGNAELAPEESYQLDAGVNWRSDRWDVQLEPFANFFPNYIYLNPTSDYYEGLQMYRYTQTRVFRWGLEFNAAYKLTAQLELRLSGDYLRSRQLSGDKRGYTLPFSPPASAAFGVKYSPQTKRTGGDAYISIDLRMVAPQNEIVPPENATAGYGLLSAAVGRAFPLSRARTGQRAPTLRVSLQANNLLNRRYYDHTSFYRLIDVPEAGRNFSIMLGFNF
jgi:iron complex outermembrane receptor protein